MSHAPSWWVVCVRDWGSVAIIGSETQAEDFRVHKARWEGCPAWKLCVRDATAEEIDSFAAARDAESGIVSLALTLPPDVAHFERMDPQAFRKVKP